MRRFSLVFLFALFACHPAPQSIIGQTTISVNSAGNDIQVFTTQGSTDVVFDQVVPEKPGITLESIPAHRHAKPRPASTATPEPAPKYNGVDPVEPTRWGRIVSLILGLIIAAWIVIKFRQFLKIRGV